MNITPSDKERERGTSPENTRDQTAHEPRPAEAGTTGHTTEPIVTEPTRAGTSTQEPRQEETPGDRTRLYAIFAAVALVLILIAFFWGRSLGMQAARDAEAQVTAVQATADEARAEAAELRAAVALLQARRHLHLALIELDRRNFGTARAHLNLAGEQLARIERPPSGIDATALARLAEQLQDARLAAGEDLFQTRSRILGWVQELDRLYPPETVSATLPAPTEDTATFPPVEAPAPPAVTPGTGEPPAAGVTPGMGETPTPSVPPGPSTGAGTEGAADGSTTTPVPAPGTPPLGYGPQGAPPAPGAGTGTQ